MIEIKYELEAAIEEYGASFGIVKRIAKHADFDEIEYPPGVNPLLATRDALIEVGDILEEDLDDGLYVASVDAGLANANAALVVGVIVGRRCVLAACAKEGLIKQSTAKKALERLKKVALGYAEKHSMKDFLLTKEELESRLIALDATREGFKPVGLFAMCYAPAMAMQDDAVPEVCEGCGKRFNVTDVRSYGDENVLDIYNEVAEEYQTLGYDAQIQYYCNECVQKNSLAGLKNGPTNVFFAFRAEGSDGYRLTPLDVNYCDDDELRMVLEFLKGAESYQELDKDYRSSSLFSTADGFKECIERVLGLEI